MCLYDPIIKPRRDCLRINSAKVNSSGGVNALNMERATNPEWGVTPIVLSDNPMATQ